VLLSSHILSEVSELCDEVMIISKGKLVARDTPENLAAVLESGSRLFMSIEGDEAEVKSVLESIGSLSKLVIKRADNGEVTVQADMAEGARNEIFYALTDARLPVHEMRAEKITLEEIFLEYTGLGKRGKHGSDL
jgi:ABC-2 type transport system ATP-binding protein